ncbi:MAG: hypothetical protein U1D55_15285 [Phycisphaerae bacterium]
MKRQRFAAAAFAATILAIDSAAAQIDCPVLSSGGDVRGDGTILILGQFAIGAISSGTTELDQGVIPCWDQTCPGDATGDNIVDESDLGLLLSQWLQTVPPNTLGDVTGDGLVNEQDLGLMLSAWQTTCQ